MCRFAIQDAVPTSSRSLCPGAPEEHQGANIDTCDILDFVPGPFYNRSDAEALVREVSDAAATSPMRTQPLLAEDEFVILGSDGVRTQWLKAGSIPGLVKIRGRRT